MNRKRGSVPSCIVTEAFNLAEHPLGAAAGVVLRAEVPGDKLLVAHIAPTRLDNIIYMNE